MDIGIIGFGKFGQFLAKLLKPRHRIFASDISDKRTAAGRIGVAFVAAEEAASKGIVIFAVPIPALEKALRGCKQFFRKGSVVMDVCSVKEITSDAMKRILPARVEIISAHPLFGPDSATAKLSIVLCPVRASVNTTAKVKQIFSGIGMRTMTATPSDHDRKIAETQALVHFIGLALKNLDVRGNEIKTPSFDKLMEMKKSMEKDAAQLSMDILRHNRHSKSMRKKFIKELQKIDRKASE